MWQFLEVNEGHLRQWLVDQPVVKNLGPSTYFLSNLSHYCDVSIFEETL